ncbi:hypothetical protein [Pantoea ananatis]|uniref:hypothetical protein n=1 Tax=Pantoea ananas TaxID=553 RepID=UPI001F5249E6|nr:hypothetical protein [Pantoea ananatis]
MSLLSVNGSIGLPRYLLTPEVTGLLQLLPDWRQHALVNTLWNTGRRLNKVLAFG